MANEQNLKSLAKRTTKEQREIAEKGGKASGVSRQKKKTKRDLIDMVLNMKPNPESIPDAVKSVADMAGIDLNDIMTNDEILALSLYAHSLTDIAFHKYLDEIMGRSPQLELKKQELALKKKQTKQETVTKNRPIISIDIGCEANNSENSGGGTDGG